MTEVSDGAELEEQRAPPGDRTQDEPTAERAIHVAMKSLSSWGLYAPRSSGHSCFPQSWSR